MRVAFLTIILGLVGPVAVAQRNNPVSTSINFKQYLDDLSQSNARCFAQDPRGYLWIGTVGGLNRFDGTDFKIYTHESGNDRSLPENRINDLYVSSKGDLWIATFEEVAKYNYETDDFTNYRKRDTTEYPSIDALTIAEDAQGQLWVGTLHGVFAIDESNNDLVRLVAGDFSTFKDREVNKMEFASGHLWMACSDGLFVANSTDQGLVRRISTDASIPADVGFVDLHRDRRGGVWLAAKTSGLAYLSEGFDGPSARWYHDQLPNQSVIEVHIDRQDRVWLGTEEAGLQLYMPTTGSFRSFQKDPDDPNSLGSSSVWRIFEDNHERLWLGSHNQGFFLFDPWDRKFDGLSAGAGQNVRLKSGTVSSFYEKDGTVWIGTDGGGISLWNREQGTFTFMGHDEMKPTSLSGDAVLCLFEDSRDRLWVGTWAAGLNQFDHETGSFQRYRHVAERPSIASNNVFDMDEDAEGRLWLATWGHGITRYNPEDESYYHVGHVKYSDKYLSSHQTYDVEVDDLTGDLWVGTVFGLDRLRFIEEDSFQISHYHPNPEVGTFLSGEFIQCIFEDSQHRIWVGTSNGLNLYDRETDAFAAFYQKDGLSSNEVRGIVEDRSGTLWISTDNGLTKMVSSDEGQWMFEAFDQADGLQSKEFFRNARFINPSGELFFGGVKGFNHFYPRDIRPDPRPPVPRIKDVSVFNQSVREDSTFHLSHSIEATEHLSFRYNQNFISIDFGVINFTHPERSEFAYRLEGLEREWNYVGDRTTATYTGLMPGKYAFLLKASNHDGVWNEDPIRLEIEVLPPWWKIWWVQLAIYGTLLGLAFGLYHWRVTAIERQKQTLELEVASRTREVLAQKRELEEQASELKEVNDQKNKLFSIIAHDLRGPLAALQGITELMDPEILDADDLKRASREINKRVRGIGGIMINLLEWARGQMEGEITSIAPCFLLPLTKEVLLGYESAAKEKGVNLSNKVTQACAAFADRDQLRLILRNLVGNAIKFTSTGDAITIACKPRNDGMMEVSVTDTGMGIPTDRLNTLFHQQAESTRGTSGEKGVGLGLMLVKEYVAKNGGDVWATSAEGEGTVFSFTLRLATATEVDIAKEERTTELTL